MVPRCKEVMNIKLEATAAGGGNMAAATPLAAAACKGLRALPERGDADASHFTSEQSKLICGLLLTAIMAKAERPPTLILDMVHHTPGQAPCSPDTRILVVAHLSD